MRRFLSILRKPVVLLALVLLALVFAAWVGVFWCWLPHRPEFEFCAHEADGLGALQSSNIEIVSSDGSEVVVQYNWLDKDSSNNVPTWEIWEPRTGRNISPKRTLDTEGGPTLEWYSAWESIAHKPHAKWVFRDDDVWKSFFLRMLQGRKTWLSEAKKDLSTFWKEEEYGSLVDLYNNPLPEYFPFTPDGRFFCYRTRDGIPFHRLGHPDREVDLLRAWNPNGLAVDELRTGKRIALIPIEPQAILSDIFISPDGRTAVTITDHHQIILWNLTTAQRRAELRLPDGMWFGTDSWPFYFAPDSGLVFCHHTFQVIWWDTAQGNRRGFIGDSGEMAILDGGRILVARSEKPNHTLYFWNTATGQKLGEMNLQAYLTDSEEIKLEGSVENGRLIAVGTFQLRGYITSAQRRNWIQRLIHWKQRKQHAQVLLVDGIDRREVALLPGVRAAFSPNGRWLATIDGDGHVRVWELPLRRPWLHIFGYAAIATLACALVFIATRWSLRRVHA
jgi:WD40 repeat protein